MQEILDQNGRHKDDVWGNFSRLPGFFGKLRTYFQVLRIRSVENPNTFPWVFACVFRTFFQGRWGGRSPTAPQPNLNW